MGVRGAEPGLENGRVEGVRLHWIFVMVSKYKGSLLSDFFFLGETSFSSLSSPALCRASILLLYSESTRRVLLIQTEVLTVETFPELYSMEEVQN